MNVQMDKNEVFSQRYVSRSFFFVVIVMLLWVYIHTGQAEKFVYFLLRAEKW